MGQREIYFGGTRYEMCDITYWPHEQDTPDFIVARDSNGSEHVCRQAYGTWMAYSPMDLITHLRVAKRNEETTNQ